MEDMSDILLVEDNKYNVEFILDALSKHNLAQRVKVFRDGGEAWTICLQPGSTLTAIPLNNPT